MIQLNVPTPSRYNKNSVIDDIALLCNKEYRKLPNCRIGFPVNTEVFVDFCLEVGYVEEIIPEPENAVIFARCERDEQNADSFVIGLNETYKTYFDERNDLKRAVIGHEAGHIILKHHNLLGNDQQSSLFDEDKKIRAYLHDSKWNPLAFNRGEMDELCKRAFRGDDAAREKLCQLDDHLEPEWMFWQAEHFSMCFLIPKDGIIDILNEGCEITNWPAINNLASRFGVSFTMMTKRLKKLGAIVINEKTIEYGDLMKQKQLFT